MGIENIFSIHLSSSLLSRIFRSGSDKSPTNSVGLNGKNMGIIEHSIIPSATKKYNNCPAIAHFI